MCWWPKVHSPQMEMWLFTRLSWWQRWASGLSPGDLPVGPVHLLAQPSMHSFRVSSFDFFKIKKKKESEKSREIVTSIRLSRFWPKEFHVKTQQLWKISIFLPVGDVTMNQTAEVLPQGPWTSPTKTLSDAVETLHVQAINFFVG